MALGSTMFSIPALRRASEAPKPAESEVKKTKILYSDNLSISFE